MYPQEEEYSSSESSKYNEASLQIIRLHELWLRAELYAKRGSLIQWKFVLDSIWRELYTDILKISNSEDKISEDSKIKLAIAKCKSKSILYQLLNKRHEQLKQIQEESGKGSIYIDINNEDFE